VLDKITGTSLDSGTQMDGLAIKAYEINQSRLKNIPLPPEFW